eukprot:GFKZ01006008.1.p1 GENE.GFKZ01006008.1~~GFKZ01006008.1.p1  ORF type:complete len:266 (-),score=21.93 GFKZ01006008.1:1387-2184(-)
MSTSTSKHAPSADHPTKTLDSQQAILHADIEAGLSHGSVTVATASPLVRLAFLRKVYSILAVQLLVTSFICALCMFVTPVRHFVLAASGFVVLVSVIGTFASLFALIAKKDSYPLNLHLLGVFTVAESLLVGSICAQYAQSGLSDLVLEALVITLAIFSGITLYAFVSKKDFSFMGGALYAALLALLGCSFINIILGITGNKSPGLAFLIAWGGSVLFSLYILYDTSVIIHHLGPDDAIMAAVTLYLDILNLFLHILSILSRSRD